MNRSATTIVFALSISLSTAALSIGGCSQSKSTPSESDARAVFENKKMLDGTKMTSVIRLVKFRKTNGKKGELAGQKFYSIEYEAEFECLEGITGWCKKGETTTRTGQLDFWLTEKGWKGQDGKIY